jgi:hypothetical protein
MRRNSDERRPSALAPEAFELLMRFQWECVRRNEPGGAKWVEFHGWPTLDHSEWHDGSLEAAAVEVARCVQGEMHRRPMPLHRGEALELAGARQLYLLALYELGGGTWRLAKETEARVAPGGRPLAMCLGTWGASVVNKKDGTGGRTIVTGLDRWGRTHRVALGGYGGCLRTFPDRPYGPGNIWPTWCGACAPGKSNAKAAAITELRRRLSS